MDLMGQRRGILLRVRATWMDKPADDRVDTIRLPIGSASFENLRSNSTWPRPGTVTFPDNSLLSMQDWNSTIDENSVLQPSNFLHLPVCFSEYAFPIGLTPKNLNARKTIEHISANP